MVSKTTYHVALLCVHLGIQVVLQASGHVSVGRLLPRYSGLWEYEGGACASLDRDTPTSCPRTSQRALWEQHQMLAMGDMSMFSLQYTVDVCEF